MKARSSSLRELHHARVLGMTAQIAAASLPGGTRSCAPRLARLCLFTCLTICLTTDGLRAQDAAAVKLPEQKQREEQAKAESKEQEKIAQQASTEIVGNTAYDDKTLRSEVKEQLSFIAQHGLTNARADDAAFFLELYYRKHGYAKVSVRYTILSGNRFRLEVAEGPLVHLAKVIFIGNRQITVDKLFDYAVGPTRQRVSKAQAALPFVPSDLSEGADLVQRFYVSEGFAECTVEPPTYHYVAPDRVNADIVIHEGRKYFFGNVSFSGPTIYGAEALRGQILDLLRLPYTAARLADIPRRLQSYYKTRGYYAVKVDAIGDPTLALQSHVPVRVTVEPGPVYYYDGVTVSGTLHLRPSYLVNRFKGLHGKPYSPETVDKKFRELIQTSLFNIVKINPTPVDGNRLRLDVNVEEAKPQEFGFSVGYGSYEGAILGVSYTNRDLFGYGRPITTSVEYTQRSYKGEVQFDDPYLFDTGFALQARLSALTFDYDGYTKFEFGGRLTLSRQITDAYSIGFVVSPRHVEITDASIDN
ncbi:MAG TPA: BamA/TamA family outer membrane protein, partial [Chthoniobacterales bacterium]